MTEAQALKLALRHLKRERFLLLVDNRQLSLVTLLTGEPIRGSWFGHPRGTLIYNTANNLEGVKGLMALKLIDGKYTFVDPAMRDATYAIAQSLDEWQARKLTQAARRLLAQVRRKKRVLVTARLKQPAALLEKLLLVAGHQEHTTSGKHVKYLLSWPEHARRKRHRVRAVPLEEAKRAWELRLLEFNRRWKSAFRLPWQRR